MKCMRLYCRFFRHRRVVWIPPVAFLTAFLIYLSFFTSLSNPTGGTDNNICMCGLCRPKRNGTEWYETRFNNSIEPLLTRKDQEIPKLVQKWWLKIQGGNNASSIPEVLEKMFKVIPPGNPYTEQQNRPCRSCAVVGNSGKLKGSNHGNKIDSHDLIFRMNGARIYGFEEDVGSRTTHHFMYPESAVHLPIGVHLMLIPFKIKDLEWVASTFTTGEIKRTYTRVMRFIRADKDKVLVVNPAFFKYIHDNWTDHHGRYPSTGMLVLFFALHICDEISVFGFGADKNGNWHHYWEKNKYAGAFRTTGVHNAGFESKLITKLVEEGKLEFYK
uniref:CMP-N-acetylneuraminate-beta-galactosamide-alpha-2,3-sialyltransferase 2 n=1 Tax=Leptobrachium leishanense TaxID=445787 RepID=A0A8C5QK27_9ANUR